MSLGAAHSGMDEYRRLMAERAAAQRRNRLVMGAVAAVLVGQGRHLVDQGEEEGRRSAGDPGRRRARTEKDKTEMGAFWNCVTSSEVDIGSARAPIRSAAHRERVLHAAEDVLEHLTTECVPKIERARQVLSA